MASSSFLSNFNSLENDTSAGFCGAAGHSFIGDLHHPHKEIKKPTNYFSTMLQISPNNANLSCNDSQSFVASPRLAKVPSSTFISSNDRMTSANSSKATNDCFTESTGLQISSQRSTGIKRR